MDRLVKELRLAGVRTLAEGNALLPAFRADYNARLANRRRIRRTNIGHCAPAMAIGKYGTVFDYPDGRLSPQQVRVRLPHLRQGSPGLADRDRAQTARGGRNPTFANPVTPASATGDVGKSYSASGR